MHGIIDRDPDQILTYVNQTNAKIEEVSMIMQRIISFTSEYAPELKDKNCLIKFKEMLESAKVLNACLDALRDENSGIETEAKRLKDIIETGMTKGKSF